MELERADRLAQLEHFQQWMREHQSEAYAAFLRYGNRYEVEDVEPEDGGAAGDLDAVFQVIVAVVRRVWSRVCGP